MLHKVFLIKLDDCVGYHSCQLACGQEHNLTFETKSTWCKVATIGPRWIDRELHMDFVPIICFQCDDPLCASCCPTNAIVRREDGMVVIDEQLCTGCRLCVNACPYGAISYNELGGVVGKCNQCSDRIKRGLEPSCVQHCIGGALQYVNHEELNSLTSGEHMLRIGILYCTSSKWKLG